MAKSLLTGGAIASNSMAEAQQRVIFHAFTNAGKTNKCATSDGKAIKIRPYMPSEPPSQACEVTISLDKSGKVAIISEENFLDFHGAQYAFSGELRAK
jgi:hypothetical protein